MENFQSTLASESFSSNWLVVNKTVPSSLVCLNSRSQDFEFDIVLPTSSYTPVDAGEIFFHGEIAPSFTNHMNSNVSYSYPSTPIICIHSSSETHNSPTHPKHLTILRRWKNSSRKILKKCFQILLSDGSNSHEQSKERNKLDFGSPKNISFDVEDSINEAIVHCKRSFNTQMI